MMDLRVERPPAARWVIYLLVLALAGWAHADIPNDFCLERELLTLGVPTQLNLGSLYLAQNDSSPCLQTGSSFKKGVWYAVEGDGTLLDFTVCSTSVIQADLFVGVHVETDCPDALDCSPYACTALECVVSSDDPDEAAELQSSADFCSDGVKWQSEIGIEYKILFYTKTEASGYVTITVNGIACDGLNTGNLVDQCGVCGGDGTSCGYRGCDGIVGSTVRLDLCGVCGGDNSTCLTGCDNQPMSIKAYDPCGVCGGDGRTCAGCDGVPAADPALRKKVDVCGVCGGDNSTCKDCLGIPNGGNYPDQCGVCGGNGTSCLDCAGCPYGDAQLDDCGVCNGDNSTCYGCDGVKGSPLKLDVCGECGGNGSSCTVGCEEGIPFSTVDACGVCNGDNSTCTCVAYEDFSVPEMDCRLVRFSLSNIVQQIDTLIDTLTSIRAQAVISDIPTAGDLRYYVADEVLDSNDFVQSCVNYYASALNAFLSDDVAPAAGVV